jgi:Zn2+/Cd2+-exporting ATPase
MDPSVQLDLPILLPSLPEGDECAMLLTQQLGRLKGVSKVHIVNEQASAQLCIHYNPTLTTLSSIKRIAEDAGTAISERYRHETIPFGGLDAADTANTLRDALNKLPGMLHADVNYAAGLLSVAYDTTVLERPQIEATVRGFGASVARPTPTGTSENEGHDEHDHGSAPSFLPHGLQERWTLLLVAIAGVFLVAGWFTETYLTLPPTVALAFFILSYIAGGYDVATHAIPGLFRGKFNTDVLMLAAAAGAALLGEWGEGAFLLFLFALGHAGEHYALDRARNAVGALGQLMPKTAQVRRGDTLAEVNVDDLAVGDIIVTRPGDRVAVDGEIVNGSSELDQSSITGESAPVSRTVGESVFAGTINHTAALEIRVTRLAKDNTLSRVMQLVAEAQSQQSPTQQFTERFTAWFVPTVLIVVALVIVAPPLIGWMTWQASFYRAMLLLVAASPCALALGTPATVLAGIAQAARNGVLIKGGVHLENLGSLNAMAFDKTGTLTHGKFTVSDIVPVEGVDADTLLRVAATVEQQSNHPLAQAVVTAASAKSLVLPVPTDVTNVPGRGLRAMVDNRPVLIGALKFFAEQDPPLRNSTVEAVVAELQEQGRSTMAVSQDGVFLGVLGLADTLRPNVSEAMNRLRTLGIQHLVMLTGDNASVAARIAKEAGVTDIRADLLPEDKLTAIQALQQTYGSIAMTGDGVNDAPALAASTVGIAMGAAGTAVALETADVALMADDIGKLPFAVGLSRASRAIIQQNLAVSLGVIFLLIVTSVMGLVQLSGAVILHEGSTIVVVLNALRLLTYRDASVNTATPKGNS